MTETSTLRQLNDFSIIVVSGQPWNHSLSECLSKRLGCTVHSIRDSETFTLKNVETINPKWIFVPHWSYLIPQLIWERWPTVIFHMTDLPYGRGGSPLQNLIKKGHVSTMMTALKCGKGFDSGPIYCKSRLDLHGTAEEIYIRANKLIANLIEQIVNESPSPTPQEGVPFIFKRLSPKDSNLKSCEEGVIEDWFNHIRMLDAEGYPHAFLDALGMRLEFRRVSQRSDGLHADVRISRIPETPSVPSHHDN